MAGMVIEIPEQFKAFGVAVAEALAGLENALSRIVGGKALDFGELEATVAEASAKIEREQIRTLLQALDVDRPVVQIGGKPYGRAGRYEAPYFTMVGPVEVERSVYRESGVRNAKTVDPVSLRAGVVADGWLPRTAQAMAHDVQRGTSREAEDSAREHMRLQYSRSSFERVAHAVAELFVQGHADIEDALIEQYEVPAEARSISVSLDRVSVPMEEPRPRPAGRPRKGAAKRPISRKFRMAYCGSVTLHDRDGKALHTIRYGRMPKGDAKGLVQGMAADVAELLRKKPSLKVELLCDGAPEMWNLLKECFTEKQLGTEVHELVDWYHAVEKLAAAARVIYGQDASKAMERWRFTLLNESDAAGQLLAVLRASGMELVTDGDQCPVHDAITYLTNHCQQLGYADARRLGLPIGSGNVEATCKSLFTVRLKRGGARWKEATGEHIVQLRALGLSDRWTQAMHLTFRPLRTAVRLAA